MARAQQRRNDQESLLARFRAATEKLRTATLRKVNTTDPGYEDLAPLSYWRERWHDPRVQQRFIEKFLVIRNAFDGNRLAPFKLNDAQLHLHTTQPKKPVTVKCRRVGSTRYWLAKFFATALINPGCHVRLVPHDPDAEEEFFTDLKTMYENLPDHLRCATRYYSKELIQFHDTEKGVVDSRITTSTPQPGREGKGRGQTYTHLLLTEVPYWSGDQSKTVTSLIEAAAGGQVAVESTAQGIEWFYETYIKAKRGEAGYQAFFFPWWWNRNYRVSGAWFRKLIGEDRVLVTPETEAQINALIKYDDDGKVYGLNGVADYLVDRHEQAVARTIVRFLRRLKYVGKNDAWYCDQVAEYIAWRRQKVAEIGETLFKIEFPENDRDCFEGTGRPVIAAQYLKVTTKFSEAKEGREYLIGGDPSAGLTTGNPGAIQVVDITVGKQVKEIVNRDKPEIFARTLCDLSDEYNGAMIIVERNGLGLAVVNAILRLGYEDRLFKQLTAAQKRQLDEGEITPEEAQQLAQPGLQTNLINKQLMGYALERQVRTKEMGLSSQSFCDNAKRVVWFDNGTFGVKNTNDGYHADDFMALAFVAYVREYELGWQSSFVGVMPEVGYAR